MRVVLAVLSIDWLGATSVRRMIERVLLAAILFAMTGFVLLVLIGLWDRYEKQAAASGSNESDERYLAPKPFLPASRIPAQMLWLSTLPKLLSIEIRGGWRRSYSRRPS